ncbi:hypothetical protein QLS71_009285 [Mariniflexile litorale]|uniref:DUF481 domain-containing protein n=1 Tax=Mariniflexile litorale TaxID=3045158 RepID=A0AAU7ELA9_9FLAO|nr:hypothetical protein [Mariniflexile sp. KMM 9835]MDQ8210593.1 hypothetical protein [Mariniflexile sp. KMM 9835]
MNKLLFIILFVFQLNNLCAQENKKLKVFIDGEIPDLGYTKRALTFVDFVTDQNVCDVYVLTSTRSTGSNGDLYYFVFTNKAMPSNDKFELNCLTYSNDTPDDIRSKFTETLKLGLVPFLNRFNTSYSIVVNELEQDENSFKEFNKTDDPWNYWVFNVSFGGDFNIEEQKKEYGYEYEFKADRVTEIWRIRNDYSFKKEEEIITKIKDSVSTDIHVLNEERQMRSRIAYSISNKLSVGLFLVNSQDTYKNIRYNSNISPALEYNIFPWSEASRRAFTISYAFGSSWLGYYEPTIFSKISEHRWREKLETKLELIEKWGVITTKLQGTHYFPKYKDYSIDLEVNLSFRLARGLFFEFGMEANKINDQFYLPLSELSDEELLLNVRKLPTSYEVSGSFGIRYQFGSIFNSIVNERF